MRVVQHVLLFAGKWTNAAWLLFNGRHFFFNIRAIDFDLHVTLALLVCKPVLGVGSDGLLCVFEEAVDALVNRRTLKRILLEVESTSLGVAFHHGRRILLLLRLLGQFLHLLGFQKSIIAVRDLNTNRLFLCCLDHVHIIKLGGVLEAGAAVYRLHRVHCFRGRGHCILFQILVIV